MKGNKLNLFVMCVLCAHVHMGECADVLYVQVKDRGLYWVTSSFILGVIFLHGRVFFWTLSSLIWKDWLVNELQKSATFSTPSTYSPTLRLEMCNYLRVCFCLLYLDMVLWTKVFTLVQQTLLWLPSPF